MGTTMQGPAILNHLRTHLFLRGIPRNSHCQNDYVRAKEAMLEWREELTDIGEIVPSYDFCIRAVADYVGV